MTPNRIAEDAGLTCTPAIHLTELQRNWDAFGHIDPLWAILTDPRLRGNKWNPAEFFSTGQREVAELMDQAARLGVPRHRRWALDFGCVVGRLAQALAESFQQTVGLDIAPSMIDLARRYNAHGSRCEYSINDTDDLSRFADGTFDLVFTGRVLQPVAPPYAENYIREFVRVLAPGGYLSFDVPSEHGLFAADGTAQPRGARRLSVRYSRLEPTSPTLARRRPASAHRCEP